MFGKFFCFFCLQHYALHIIFQVNCSGCVSYICLKNKLHNYLLCLLPVVFLWFIHVHWNIYLICYKSIQFSVTFESFPQALIQATILLGSVSIFQDSDDVREFVGQNEVLISAVIAVVNGSLQFARIYCEAKAVDEKFIQYALNCAISRVKWLPFERKLIALLRAGGNEDDGEQDSNEHMSYKISYDIPFFTWLLQKFKGMEPGFGFFLFYFLFLVCSFSVFAWLCFSDTKSFSCR